MCCRALCSISTPPKSKVFDVWIILYSSLLLFFSLLSHVLTYFDSWLHCYWYQDCPACCQNLQCKFYPSLTSDPTPSLMISLHSLSPLLLLSLPHSLMFRLPKCPAWPPATPSVTKANTLISCVQFQPTLLWYLFVLFCFFSFLLTFLSSYLPHFWFMHLFFIFYLDSRHHSYVYEVWMEEEAHRLNNWWISLLFWFLCSPLFFFFFFWFFIFWFDSLT